MENYVFGTHYIMHVYNSSVLSMYLLIFSIQLQLHVN